MKKIIFLFTVLFLFSCKNGKNDQIKTVPVIAYYDNDTRLVKSIGNYQPGAEKGQVRVFSGLEIRETYTRKEILSQMKQSGLLEMVKPFDPGIKYDGDSPIILSADPYVQSRLFFTPEIMNFFPKDLKFCWTLKKTEQVSGKRMELCHLYAVKTSGKSISHQDIAGASAEPDEQTLQHSLQIEMTEAGAKKWEKMTSENKGRVLAIMVGNVVISAPLVYGAIKGGKTEISGNFTEQETKGLSDEVNAYVLNGEWRSYHRNGKLKAIRHYEKGEQVGAWATYDENGKLTKKGEI